MYTFVAIYGGFARSCIAKTMEDNIENEYVVTDENGCATDPSIFGEWDYSPDANSLLASFNAFKFPSSDNIRFQCNIRVCFGRCQPVNCRGYNAFGKRRRRREVGDTNSSSTGIALPKREETNGMDGALREEITISSNAILTFEKRDERFADGSDSECYVSTEFHFDQNTNGILMRVHFFSNSFCYSSSGCTESGRHLRIDDWFNHSFGDYSIIGISSCCRCSFLLVNGIQTTTKSNWPLAASTRIPESIVCQSRRSIRTNTRLSLVE